MAATAISSIRSAVQRCVASSKAVEAAYVFGSAVTGRMRADSDIDVALLLSQTVRPSQFLKYRLDLMADLGAALHRTKIDVIVLNEATPLLAHRVLSKGKLVFERSASVRVRFQVQTANRYLDLIPMFETHIRYLKKSAREGRVIG